MESVARHRFILNSTRDWFLRWCETFLLNRGEELDTPQFSSLWNGFYIRALQLSSDRVEIELEYEYDDPRLNQVMIDLLIAINERWPESGLQESQPDSDDPPLTIEADGLAGKDRALLARWQRGDAAAVIAQHLSVTSRTVYNRASELRATYGEEVVPKRR